ncbi:RICIN domain-containing protein [Dictyobacter aurantiacus]|uniref:Ricin B lectin domain-containing protein n=1 Tax=Dictyobacter aurantiacus TaxID=1936993 RepID=A0A401ZKM2_9CHLR|nr:RICIN domain-containing protein [Dictyobacter aurantiacus]GCE07405.1 hypothetical protein KDAU_47340 [Dictyobacter aurantiacus]
MIQDENVFDSHEEIWDRHNQQLSRGRFLKLAAAGALGAAGLALGMPQGSHAAGNDPVPPPPHPMPPRPTPIGPPIHYRVMPGLYVIQSYLNGYVLDVKGASTTPGTLIINYPANSPLTLNQVWYISADGYITSMLNGYVLDVRGASTSPGASVISYPRNVPASSNQRWNFTRDGYISSQLNGYVLDVQGSNTAPGTPVITYPRNYPSSANQRWHLRALTWSS